MVLFLRTKDNKTIIEVEYYVKDEYLEVSSTVDVEIYSNVLISKFVDGDLAEMRSEFISDIASIDEARGWLWEVYFMGRKNTKDEYDEVLKELRNTILHVANKYDFIYVED